MPQVEKMAKKPAVSRGRLWTAAVGAAAGLGAMLNAASGAQYVYTPMNTTTDVWSAGTNWSPGAPASAADTQLTYVADNTTAFASALVNVNTDDIAGAFNLNILDLQGTGPATGGTAATVTIAAAAGSSLNFVANGATNPVVNLNANVGTLAGGLTYNVSPPVALGAATTLTGAGTAAFNFTGVISGTAAVTKTGTSAVSFSGANTYNGGFTLNGGTARAGVGTTGTAGSPTNGPFGTGTLTLTSGTLMSNNTTARTIANAVTVAGNVTLGDATNTGALTFSGPVTLTASRTLTLNSTATISGAVGQSASGFGLTKSGGGTLILSSSTANAYSGGTTITNGVLQISNDNQLGAAGTAVSVTATGGQLLLSGAGTYGTGRTINITGAGAGSVGALSSSSTATNTVWAGNVNVATDQARIGAPVANGFLDVTGVVSGTNTAPVVRTTNNTAVVQFSNANTYTGTNTQVVVGGLKLNHAGALPSTTGVTFGNNSGQGTGTSLDLNGNNTSLLGVATIAGNNIAATITSTTAATLTLGNSTPTAFTFGDTVTATNFGSIAGAIALAKAGTNTQTLAGLANTYTGGTTITGGGTLALASTATLGTGDVTVTPAAAASTTLDLSAAAPAAAGTIADTATLTLSSSGTNFGRVAFGANTLNEVVGALVVNGMPEPAGTYTSGTLPNFITGSGSITVTPEPASAGLIAVAAAGLLARRRRRRS